jgi:hypothetical protein
MIKRASDCFVDCPLCSLTHHLQTGNAAFGLNVPDVGVALRFVQAGEGLLFFWGGLESVCALLVGYARAQGSHPASMSWIVHDVLKRDQTDSQY